MEFLKKFILVAISVTVCSLGAYLYLSSSPGSGCPLRRLLGMAPKKEKCISRERGHVSSSSSCPIGVLNFESCVTGSKHGQRGTGLLESANQKMREELRELDERIQSLQDQLQDENIKESMTEEARTAIQREWMGLRRTRDERAANGSNQIYRLQMELVQKLGEMISNASESVCKRYGLKLLISSGATHYHDESLNMTDEVISALNEIEDFILSDPSAGQEMESGDLEDREAG
ncbi:OmpH family outer membrane protein [Candidatus Similichlamydia laticola]|uniref:Outer membrane protein H n=1 Tax=Candidatus Similichlamydia laticola TaxID=2170265 RepID=A0A369KAC7_9BACT|nr:OmpH family outer membrane protein [Candidatus Similichlamydia laticola]RDB31549.1 hypothetical protein HAT2_00352 [Candidatus Similichlamydia laticola]